MGNFTLNFCYALYKGSVVSSSRSSTVISTPPPPPPNPFFFFTIKKHTLIILLHETGTFRLSTTCISHCAGSRFTSCISYRFKRQRLHLDLEVHNASKMCNNIITPTPSNVFHASFVPYLGLDHLFWDALHGSLQPALQTLGKVTDGLRQGTCSQQAQSRHHQSALLVATTGNRDAPHATLTLRSTSHSTVLAITLLHV